MSGATLKRAGVALLTGFALLGAGCGGTAIDAERIEDAIEQSATDAGVGDRVRDIDCPDDPRSETGYRFACTLTRTDGGEELIPVEVTDGENGRVSYGTAVR